MAKALDVVKRLGAAKLGPEQLFADGSHPSVPSTVKVVETNGECIAAVNHGRISDEVMGGDQFEVDKGPGCQVP